MLFVNGNNVYKSTSSPVREISPAGSRQAVSSVRTRVHQQDRVSPALWERTWLDAATKQNLMTQMLIAEEERETKGKGPAKQCEWNPG